MCERFAATQAFFEIWFIEWVFVPLTWIDFQRPHIFWLHSNSSVLNQIKKLKLSGRWIWMKTEIEYEGYNCGRNIKNFERIEKKRFISWGFSWTFLHLNLDKLTVLLFSMDLRMCLNYLILWNNEQRNMHAITKFLSPWMNKTIECVAYERNSLIFAMTGPNGIYPSQSQNSNRMK